MRPCAFERDDLVALVRRDPEPAVLEEQAVGAVQADREHRDRVARDVHLQHAVVARVGDVERRSRSAESARPLAPKGGEPAVASCESCDTVVTGHGVAHVVALAT